MSVWISGKDLDLVRSRGYKLTFKPVGGGKLICNQLPQLGRISSKQAETLRRSLHPKKHCPGGRVLQQLPKSKIRDPGQQRNTMNPNVDFSMGIPAYQEKWLR